MTDPKIQNELMNLKSQLSVSQALISSAQGQAGIPVTPNVPSAGLNALAQAVSQQQVALTKIVNFLEKIV